VGGWFRGKSILRGIGVVVVVYRTLRSIGAYRDVDGYSINRLLKEQLPPGDSVAK
jgi:hypothetical protein